MTRTHSGNRSDEARPRLEGVLAPVPTPFLSDGTFDRTAFRENLSRWIEAGLHGFVVLGSAGEAPMLSEEEAVDVLHSAREAIPEDRWMIAGVGRHATRLTIDAARAARDAGADAALVLPPYYYRRVTSNSALVEHFRSLADAVDLPLLIYNMPSYTGVDLPTPTIVAMAEIPGIIGIKDSSGDLTKLAAVRHQTPNAFAVLAGSAGFFVPALASGASGGVLALANIAPTMCLRLWNAAQSGHWDEARDLQARLIEANAAITRRWGPAGLKTALDLLGYRGGAPRPPLSALPEEAQKELASVLMEAGLQMDAKEAQ
jgi:4-hydroxy-2-oxoglutarate aldolase